MALTSYELSRALPNKLLNSDGSITDFQGNLIQPPDESRARAYSVATSVANKFEDQDGKIKTFAEITLDIFVPVEELPEYGEKNKIYLVPSKDFPGEFDEYFWNPNNQWDRVGRVKMDLSNYPTNEQMQNAIETAENNAKLYTDQQIRLKVTDVLGGIY